MSKDLFDIQGKVVLVTGANGGIGSGIAQSFGAQGAKLVLVDWNAQPEQEVDASKDFPFKPLYIQADLREESEINSIIDNTMAEYGRIDCLVNCLGVNRRKHLEEYTSDDWDYILDINLKSVFFLTKKAGEIMKKQRYGRIVSISSIQSAVGWSGAGQFSIAPYGASKSGLNSITRYFALDYAKYNITANVVCPGFVETPLVAKLKDDELIGGDIISRTPIGRFAKIEEIAAPVLFLCSDASSYVTGHTMFVDGGWTAQ
jgi:2-deoxy-D-gluconate 3-dehydrogenase